MAFNSCICNHKGLCFGSEVAGSGILVYMLAGPGRHIRQEGGRPGGRFLLTEQFLPRLDDHAVGLLGNPAVLDGWFFGGEGGAADDLGFLQGGLRVARHRARVDADIPADGIPFPIRPDLVVISGWPLGMGASGHQVGLFVAAHLGIPLFQLLYNGFLFRGQLRHRGRRRFRGGTRLLWCRVPGVRNGEHAGDCKRDAG